MMGGHRMTKRATENDVEFKHHFELFENAGIERYYIIF
jgi:hypothetical protein